MHKCRFPLFKFSDISDTLIPGTCIRPVGYFFTIFLAVFQFRLGFSQNLYNAADSAEIYRLLDLADEQDFQGELSNAMNTANEALRISQLKKMQRGEGFANLKIADLLLKKGETGDIDKYYSEGLRIGNHLKDSFLTGLTYNQIAQFHFSHNAYEEAQKNLSKALQCYHAVGLNDYMSLVYNDLGFVADKLGDYPYAVECYLKAIRIREDSGEEKELANALSNLAIVFFRMGHKEESARIFKKCLAIPKKIGDVKRVAATAGNLVIIYLPSNLDSALFYQDMALVHAEKSGLKSNLAHSYQGKAGILKRQKNYADAITWDLKASEIYSEAGNMEKVIPRYISIADTYDLAGDSLQAESYYDKAFNLIQHLNGKPLKAEFYRAKSNFYQNHHNFAAAFANLKSHYVYKDSLFNEKSETAISELKIRYDAEKKDFEITRLSNEQKIRQLELEKQHAIIAGNILEAQKKENEIKLLNQQQKLRETEFLQQKELYEKQLLESKTQEQELKIVEQQLQISNQEKEIQDRALQRQGTIKWVIVGFGLLGILLTYFALNRRQLKRKLEHQKSLFDIRNNIARDLHDEIGSTLSSINILSLVSSQAVEESPSKAKEMMSEINTQSQTIQQKMSDIVWAIRPDNEKIEALSGRIREFAARMLLTSARKIKFSEI